jgi:hypothetical protein
LETININCRQLLRVCFLEIFHELEFMTDLLSLYILVIPKFIV